MASRLWFTFGMFLLSLTACERFKTKARPVPAAASSVSSPVAAAASTAPEPAGASAPSGAPTRPIEASTRDAVHCKALGKRGLVSIGLLGEEIVDMVTEADNLIVFSYHEKLARFSMTQYRRDGTPPLVVVRHTGPGEPKNPQLTSDAVYFLRNRNLFRLPRHGEAATALAQKFSNAIAVHAGFVYGISCEPQQPMDHLIRISTQGGTVETLVDFDRNTPKGTDAGTTECDYRSLVADDGVVFASHWNGRRVLRISLADRTVLELATKKEFADHLRLAGDQLLFQAGGGVYRISKTAADAARITELGRSPFAYYVADADSLYIHDSVPYAPEEWTYEITLPSSKPKKLEYYRVLDPNEVPADVGIRGLAVDDECIYIARRLAKHTAIYGRSRQ